MTVWDGRGLPPVARARIERAAGDGMSTSLLSVPGAAAAESVGLVSVGEVMGCCVMHLGWAGWHGCMAWGGGYGYSGAPIVDGFQPYVSAVRTGYAKALARLENEAKALHAQGVIDIRITVERLDSDQHEFVMLGTAVRFVGHTDQVPRPFVTELTGVDTAALLRAGWLPASILIGLAISVRHDDWSTQLQSSWGAGNVEVTGLSQLTAQVRIRGRDSMVAQASAMDGVLVTSQQLTVWEQEPADNHRDHVAEMRMFGTGLIRLNGPRQKPTTLTILPLSAMPAGRRARFS